MKWEKRVYKFHGFTMNAKKKKKENNYLVIKSFKRTTDYDEKKFIEILHKSTTKLYLTHAPSTITQSSQFCFIISVPFQLVTKYTC